MINISNLIIIYVNGTKFFCSLYDCDKNKLKILAQLAKSLSSNITSNSNDEMIFNCFMLQAKNKYKIQLKKIPITSVIRIKM